MRTLQNFKGFHSNGRDIFPAGFTLADLSIECGQIPQYQTAYTFSRVQGVSNTINIQVVAPIAASEILTLWYYVSSDPLELSLTVAPTEQGFTDITLGGTISGITNGHYVYFGIDSSDPSSGTEIINYDLKVSNVTPGLTLESVQIANFC